MDLSLREVERVLEETLTDIRMKRALVCEG